MNRITITKNSQNL